ncbi:hypothetical protein ACSLOE_30480, partial [Escherichia coli]
IRHVNEHGITFQEYRFNEYKNQIEKIAFYLGHETVAKWYGDYLLGRERNREGATVLQGNPEEVRELIDATPFAKKYTSGVLS